MKYGKSFLIVRRAEHDSFPGRWEFPGGIVEEGESVSGAAIRELKEETGIDARQVKVGDEYTAEGENGIWELHPVLFELEEKPEIELSAEHSDSKWVKKAELRDMETLGDLKSLQNLGLEI